MRTLTAPARVGVALTHLNGHGWTLVGQIALTILVWCGVLLAYATMASVAMFIAGMYLMVCFFCILLYVSTVFLFGSGTIALLPWRW